jgi:hypothetical protein
MVEAAHPICPAGRPLWNRVARFQLFSGTLGSAR